MGKGNIQMIQNLLEEILKYLNNTYSMKDCDHKYYCTCDYLYSSDEDPEQLKNKIKSALEQING